MMFTKAALLTLTAPGSLMVTSGHQWSPLTCPGVVRVRVNTPLIIRESGPRSCEHQRVSLLMEILTEDIMI